MEKKSEMWFMNPHKTEKRLERWASWPSVRDSENGLCCRPSEISLARCELFWRDNGLEAPREPSSLSTLEPAPSYPWKACL